jgi:hypothetical protein
MSLATNGTGLPELLDSLIIDGIAQLDQKDPREFSVVEAVIEDLETIDLGRTGSGIWVVLPRATTSTSAGRSPSMPCCRKRRVSLRTVAGWVCVSRERCCGVRSAKRTTGRMTS